MKMVRPNKKSIFICRDKRVFFLVGTWSEIISLIIELWFQYRISKVAKLYIT